MLKIDAIPDVNNVDSLYNYLAEFSNVDNSKKWNVSFAEALEKKSATNYESALIEYAYMQQMLGIKTVRLWLIEDVEVDNENYKAKYHINRAQLFVSYLDDEMNVVWVEPWWEYHKEIRKYKSYARMLKNVRARFVDSYEMKGKTIIGEVVGVSNFENEMKADTLVAQCNRSLEVMNWFGTWKIKDRG